ncbi:DUF6053 domain-containing protein [Lysobacter enzymogenes]|uniref:DUF6053 domain-containing protein n=1 Tax=Lysobacter enzymogenes TaxID=69 RepID=UPI003399EC8E
MGGPSGPTLSGQTVEIRDRSIGPEGPPTENIGPQGPPAQSGAAEAAPWAALRPRRSARAAPAATTPGPCRGSRAS